MIGYGPSSYGDGMADVYDDWYADVTDVAACAARLAELAEGGPALELGIGTGRVALVLAGRGVRVAGVDASEAMLARLRAKPGGQDVAVHLGDMAGPLPAGPWALVFVAYNTLFNLDSLEAQAACLTETARVLRPGGRLVVEAAVPADDLGDAHGGERRGTEVPVTLRALSADRVVLSVARHDPRTRIAEGSFVDLSGGGVQLRPWRIRHSTPAELDDLAAAAGLALEHRWAGWAGEPFSPESTVHVSCYQRRQPAGAA